MIIYKGNKIIQEQVLIRAKEKVKEFGRLLFLTQTGSKLYGTNTPSSYMRTS